MSIATCIGRIGVLAVTLGVGFSVVAPGVAEATDPPDSTALILCGTTCPTPDERWIDSVKSQFIAPTHPDQDIDYVAVTTPQEYWPITGLFRLIGLAIGDLDFFGPGGPAWPDQPWWKLSGLFDLTINQSIKAGVTDLEAAMANYGNDNLVVFGYSQSAAVAVEAKRRLAARYPAGTEAPDIDFVLGGDTNLPNGGLNARFPGLYIPILDLLFNGPEPTNTPFDTVVITRQFDGAADFPLYPLNLIATLNAVLGFVYLHTHPFAVSLPPDPTTSSAYQGTHGDTSYYFFETADLPLFAPLRTLGVPEPLIDVVEPFFRVLVELGYDRSISPWEPTPVRLIPRLDPLAVMTVLFGAIVEGVSNALVLVGLPPLVGVPAPVTPVAEATESTTTVSSTPPASMDTPTRAEQETPTSPEIGIRQISTDTTASATAAVGTTDASPQAQTQAVTETDLPLPGQPETDTQRSTSKENPIEFTEATTQPANAGGVDQQPADRSPRGGDEQLTASEQVGAEASTDAPPSTASSSAASASDDSSSGGHGDDS